MNRAMCSEESAACLGEKMKGDEEKSSKRATWARSAEFLLNVAGYNVGLGNVWRFSYLCYKNGGGTFFIPYLLVAAFCGLPLLFQEIAMGQFTKRGCIGAWEVAPLMQGIGYSALLLCLYVLGYFALVMAWCVFYLFHSLTSNALPWSTCDNWWNSDECVITLSTHETSNYTANVTECNTTILSPNASTATDEFWNNYVLQKTDSLSDMGSLKNWRMALCYVFSWAVCYMCMAKGIKTTGKVSYLTVILPYIMVFILLVRGLTLEGATEGVLYYVTPDLARLGDPTVWLDAGSQILYSLGVTYSVLYGFGSYNEFSTDCYRMAFFSVAICCGSSIVFGFAVFSFLGHMAFETGKNISEVTEGGPGLVFQVYPNAISLLPLPQMWSAIFFIVLTFLAVDSEFATMEGVMVIMEDICPKKFRGKGKYKYRTAVCFLIMLTGIPLLFDGGIYVFELLNNYGASGICILWLAFFESVAVGWIYGVDNFYEDVKSMIGYYPNVFFKYSYLYFTPLVTMSIFTFLCVEYKPLVLGSYTYPWWGNLIGWSLSASVFCCIPIVAIRRLLQAKGTFKERWRQATTSRLAQSAPDTLSEDDKPEVSTI